MAWQPDSVVSLSLAPARYDAHAAGVTVTLHGLWEAVRRAAGECPEVSLLGADLIVDEGSPIDTPDQQRRLADQIRTAVEITGRGHRYRLAYDFQAAHQHGEGGQTAASVQLYRDEQPVLMCVSGETYTTLSDDSDDYPSGGRDDVYLLDARDRLAAAVFALLQAGHRRKPR